MFVDNYLAFNGPAGPVGVPNYQSGAVVNELTGGGPVVSWDNGFRRPYIDKNGQLAVTINRGRKTNDRGERVPIREHVLVRDLINNYGLQMPFPVTNATALRKEEWLQVDRVVLEAATYEQRAWGDLMASNSYGGFNGMGKMILEHETMSDPGEAVVDMTGLTMGRNDLAQFQLEGLPLPITHSDFWIDLRKLTASRNSGSPLDTAMSRACGRRVGESVEKTTIGVKTGVTYGGNSTQVGGYGRTSAVYGYTNFPTRITKTNLTTPTGSNASTTLAEVLAMRDQLYAAKFKGPFIIYHSNDWDQYMDNDYILTGGNTATQTLRERLKSIEGVTDVRRLDFLFGTAPQTDPYWTSSTVGTTGKAIYRGPGGDVDATLKAYTLIMVQMTPEVARAVNGMDITTVQWETVGGMQLNFKVMCIQVPQLRADYYGNCGILHATTS